MQSNQSTREQIEVNSSGGYSGGSQNTTADALPPIGSNIQQTLKRSEGFVLLGRLCQGVLQRIPALI